MEHFSLKINQPLEASLWPTALLSLPNPHKAFDSLLGIHYYARMYIFQLILIIIIAASGFISTNAFAHAVMTKNVVMAEAILEQLEEHPELSETLEKIRNDLNEPPFSNTDVFSLVDTAIGLVSHPIETIREEQTSWRINRRYTWMSRQLAERQALRSVTEGNQSTADLAN